MFLVPCSLFFVPRSGSGFWLPASGLRVLASGFRLPASGFRVLASAFRLPASGFWPPASGFWLLASGPVPVQPDPQWDSRASEAAVSGPGSRPGSRPWDLRLSLWPPPPKKGCLLVTGRLQREWGGDGDGRGMDSTSANSSSFSGCSAAVGRCRRSQLDLWSAQGCLGGHTG